MIKKVKKKGSLLLVAVVILIFLLIFTFLIVTTTRKATVQATRTQQNQQALQAAISGLDYAQLRIRQWEKEGKTWTGTQWNQKETIQNYIFEEQEKKTRIVEHHIKDNMGWVEGTLDSDGLKSKFYIFFKKPTPPYFEDPLTGTVETKYLSLNNINSPRSAKNYDAEGNLFKTVPPYTAHIIVQGRCGQEEKFVEAMFLKLPDKNYQSVSVSGGDTIIKLHPNPNRWIISSKTVIPGTVRSNKRIIAINVPNPLPAHDKKTASEKKDPFDSLLSDSEKGAEIIIDNGGKMEAGEEIIPPRSSSAGFREKSGEQSRHIPPLTMPSQDYTKENSPVEIPAGVYTFSLRNNQVTVVSPGVPSQILKILEEKVFSPDSSIPPVVLINTPIEIKEGENKDLVFLHAHNQNITFRFNHVPPNPLFILNRYGNITIEGDITGEGSVYSGGSVSFSGTSLLSPHEPNLFIWAEKNININHTSHNPDKNPSCYIAQALLDYLSHDAREEKGFKIITLDKKTTDILLNKKIPLNPGETSQPLEVSLAEILSDEEMGFLYSHDRQTELLRELLNNTCDKIQPSPDRKNNHIYFFSRDSFIERTEDIIKDPHDSVYSIKPHDQIFQGTIFCKGDFKAPLQQSRWTLKGSLICEGNIEIYAQGITMLYSPEYTTPLYNLGNPSYQQLYWTHY